MLRTFDELSTTQSEDEENQVDNIAAMAENNYTVDIPSLINRFNKLETIVEGLVNERNSEQQRNADNSETNTTDNPINGTNDTEDKEEDKE